MSIYADSKGNRARDWVFTEFKEREFLEIQTVESYFQKCSLTDQVSEMAVDGENKVVVVRFKEPQYKGTFRCLSKFLKIEGVLKSCFNEEPFENKFPLGKNLTDLSNCQSESFCSLNSMREFVVGSNSQTHQEKDNSNDSHPRSASPQNHSQNTTLSLTSFDSNNRSFHSALNNFLENESLNVSLHQQLNQLPQADFEEMSQSYSEEVHQPQFHIEEIQVAQSPHFEKGKKEDNSANILANQSVVLSQYEKNDPRFSKEAFLHILTDLIEYLKDDWKRDICDFLICHLYQNYYYFDKYGDLLMEYAYCFLKVKQCRQNEQRRLIN